MPTPKALLFDLGNVLFEIDIPGCSQRIYDLLDEKTDRDSFRKEFKQKNEGLETGEISKGVFVNFILSHCKKGVQALEVILSWNSMLIGMPDKHFKMLEECRKKYKVYLLSNINDFHIKRFREMIVEDHGITDFDGYFNQCFYSSEIGYRKPDQACYQYVLSEIGLKPEEVLFFDDTAANVEAARALGIQAQHVVNFGDTYAMVQNLK